MDDPKNLFIPILIFLAFGYVAIKLFVEIPRSRRRTASAEGRVIAAEIHCTYGYPGRSRYPRIRARGF